MAALIGDVGREAHYPFAPRITLQLTELPARVVHYCCVFKFIDARG